MSQRHAGDHIRVAREDDAAQLVAIYEPIVSNTAISFETEVPSPEEMWVRVRDTLEAFPWLVLERDGKVLGYAYASPFRERPAYRWSAEASIYVAEDARGSGVGTALGRSLLSTLGELGFVNALAAIALPNAPSVRLMASLGFDPVGVIKGAGYKHGAWHDVQWWQRRLGEPGPDPAPPSPFRPAPP